MTSHYLLAFNEFISYKTLLSSLLMTLMILFSENYYLIFSFIFFNLMVILAIVSEILLSHRIFHYYSLPLSLSSLHQRFPIFLPDAFLVPQGLISFHVLIIVLILINNLSIVLTLIMFLPYGFIFYFQRILLFWGVTNVLQIEPLIIEWFQIKYIVFSQVLLNWLRLFLV